jgi:hypothetical protein
VNIKGSGKRGVMKVMFRRTVYTRKIGVDVHWGAASYDCGDNYKLLIWIWLWDRVLAIFILKAKCI